MFWGLCKGHLPEISLAVLGARASPAGACTRVCLWEHMCVYGVWMHMCRAQSSVGVHVPSCFWVCTQWVWLLGVPGAEVAGCLRHVPERASCPLQELFRGLLEAPGPLKGAQPLLGGLGVPGSPCLTLPCDPEGLPPLVSVGPKQDFD